jgi:hypothetical protein
MSTLQEIKDDKKEEKENQEINMSVNLFSLTPVSRVSNLFCKISLKMAECSEAKTLSEAPRQKRSNS